MHADLHKSIIGWRVKLGRHVFAVMYEADADHLVLEATFQYLPFRRVQYSADVKMFTKPGAPWGVEWYSILCRNVHFGAIG